MTEPGICHFCARGDCTSCNRAGCTCPRLHVPVPDTSGDDDDA